MNEQKQSLYFIHIAVLFFGLAGLFGKIIDQPAIIITLGRVVFAALGLGLILLFTKNGFRIYTFKNGFLLILAGIVLAFHWWAFFYAIQLSSVAIGLLTFSTFPVFTVFLEPLFYREKIVVKNIFVAILTFLGIYLIVPEFNIDNAFFMGAFWGTMSGFLFSVLQLLNRFLVKSASGMQVTFYEVLISSIVLFPFLFIEKMEISTTDILYLFLLGTVFTAMAHSLFIHGLKKVNVFVSSIIASLEPVYGILFAILLLSEIPDLITIIGGLIIVASNFLVLFFKKSHAAIS